MKKSIDKKCNFKLLRAVIFVAMVFCCCFVFPCSNRAEAVLERVDLGQGISLILDWNKTDRTGANGEKINARDAQILDIRVESIETTGPTNGRLDKIKIKIPDTIEVANNYYYSDDSDGEGEDGDADEEENDNDSDGEGEDGGADEEEDDNPPKIRLRIAKVDEGILAKIQERFDVEYSKSLTIVPRNALKGHEGVYIIFDHDGASAYVKKVYTQGYEGDGTITLPERMEVGANGGNVRLGKICCEAFWGIKNLVRKVIVPYDVICSEDCKDLIGEIKLPKDIKKIDEGIFRGCSGLVHVNLPNSVKFLSDECFKDCSRLRVVELPKNIKKIGEKCFQNCSDLEEIKLPQDTQGIDGTLPYAYIPDSVEILGDGCFENCKSLRRVETYLTELGNRIFKGCEKLELVSFRSNVESIGKRCFDGCESLSWVCFPGMENCINSLVFPESLKSLGKCCFLNCHSLEKVSLKFPIFLGQYCFGCCEGLVTVKIVSGKNFKIENYVFYNCNSIQNFSLSKEDLADDFFEKILALTMFRPSTIK
ncbi:MAG: leucine-rich repeat protein [Oscillospiraceae bacterium]|nr:leucine-rich repeat protein [Oscillospiraceae bacterium]